MVRRELRDAEHADRPDAAVDEDLALPPVNMSRYNLLVNWYPTEASVRAFLNIPQWCVDLESQHFTRQTSEDRVRMLAIAAWWFDERTKLVKFAYSHNAMRATAVLNVFALPDAPGDGYVSRAVVLPPKLWEDECLLPWYQIRQVTKRLHEKGLLWFLPVKPVQDFDVSGGYCYDPLPPGAKAPRATPWALAPTPLLRQAIRDAPTGNVVTAVPDILHRGLYCTSGLSRLCAQLYWQYKTSAKQKRLYSLRGGYAPCSMLNLATDLGVSVDTVKRNAAKLVEFGLWRCATVRQGPDEVTGWWPDLDKLEELVMASREQEDARRERLYAALKRWRRGIRI